MAKKFFGFLFRLFTVLLMIFAVFIMIFTIISVGNFDKTDGKGLFGYRYFIVLSDSMKGVFDVGDVAVCQIVDPETLQEGDVIAFKSTDTNNYGEVITHKIREVITNEDGETQFVTYGVATDTDDVTPADADMVLGRFTSAIPKAGYVFQFLKSSPGYFLLIFLPFALLIISQTVKFFSLLKKYKKEQLTLLEQQNKELEYERLKTQEMMNELQDIKEDLLEKKSELEKAPAAAPQYDAPPYGRGYPPPAPYGQPPYGQPPYGQPPYGVPPRDPRYPYDPYNNGRY